MSGTIAFAIGASLSTTASAQSFDDRNTPDLTPEEFNFIEAWGSAPLINETSMTLLNDDSTCVPAPNGLSCTESRVGLSLYDNGPDSPFFEDFGSLTSMYVRNLPVDHSYEEVDFSLVQRDHPDVITSGTAYFQEGLVAGILTTPTGYQMAVSGVIILNVVTFESPQDAILDTALFVPTHQWHDLNAAMDALDDEADTLWSFVNDAETDAPAKDGQDPFQMKNRANNCLKQYKSAKKRCRREFDTNNKNTQRIMETCLENVGLGNVVAGVATYGGASAVACGGTTALYTWWLGPFSGPATALSGAVGGLYGGIVGAIKGPADARAECRKTAADSRAHNFDLYKDCLDNALDEYRDCLNN